MRQSVGTASAIPFPPVRNIEQFRNRFKVLVKAACLSPGEADWIEILSAKFGSEPDQGWSECDLATFLAITIPDELKSDIAAAAPLLHRCLRHLGSFPFHISDPSPVLDCETLCVGIVLLLRRHEFNLYSLYEDEDSEEWMRRLLFQSMSANKLPAPVAWPSPDARGGPDDEHLLRAHGLVSSFNKRRDKSRPMVMYYGPPIIDVSQLPPSRSQDFSGSISSEQLRPLLRLLVASQLFLTGIGPDVVGRDPRKLDASVDSIIGTFTDTMTQSGITWESFELVLKRHTPNLFHGLSRLLGLLVLDGGLDHEHIRSFVQAQVAWKLKVVFTSDFDVPELSVGAVFGPAILAQVSTFLPLDAPLQSPAIMYSSKSDAFQDAELFQHLKATARPMMLLVNGPTMTTDSNQNGNDCCYGAFLPQDPEHAAALFQLQPVHRVYPGTIRVSPIPSDTGIQTFQIQVRMADSTEVCLDMGGPGTTGRLSSGRQEKQRFIVASVDLVGLAPNARSYDLKQDRRFWVDRDV
ncbi:Restriction of telomere capping protein 5 [Apiospora sp. TS-2023a]